MKASFALFIGLLTWPVFASAEDINLATWYPNTPNQARVHGDRGSIGAAYNIATVLDANIPDGNLIVARGVGIGTWQPLAGVAGREVRLDVRGVAAINGGRLWGAENSKLLPGALNIGDFNRNFGGQSGAVGDNMAGLLLETLDNTEIAVHDNGQRFASLMYYEGGGTNRITLGRNMGWGTIGTIALNGMVGINGGRIASSGPGQLLPGALCIGDPGLDYGGGAGWNGNVAALLLEADNDTEIAVHDRLTRIASLMRYQGAGVNKLTIGRNMGWDFINTVAIPGNVGIGTVNPGTPSARPVNPGAPLTVSGNARFFNSTNGYGEINLERTEAGTFDGFQIRKETGNFWAVKSVGASNNLGLYVDNDSSRGIFVQTGATLGSAYIGFGTTNPQRGLDFVVRNPSYAAGRTLRLTSDNTGYVDLQLEGASTGRPYNNGRFTIRAVPTGPLHIYGVEGSGAHLTFEPSGPGFSGRLAVGDYPTDVNGQPTYFNNLFPLPGHNPALIVNGQLALLGNRTYLPDAHWFMVGNYREGSDGHALLFQKSVYAQAPRHRILVGSAWRFEGNSDVRLKKDVATVPNSLDRLATIRGVTFRWADPSAGSLLRMGVLAQDVEKVFPESVSTGPDGMKSVAYLELIAPLIEAAKELKARNDRLQEQVNSLKNNNRELAERIRALEKKGPGRN